MIACDRSAGGTLLLSRGDVVGLLTLSECVAVVATAYERAVAAGRGIAFSFSGGEPTSGS